MWIDYLLKRVQKSWIKRYMIICPHLTSVANVWLRNFVTTTHEFRLSHNFVLRLHGKGIGSSSTHPSCKVTLSDWGHVEHRTLKKSRCVVCLFNKHIQILNIQCISKFSALSERKKLHDTNRRWGKVDLELVFASSESNNMQGERLFLSSHPQEFIDRFEINVKPTFQLGLWNTVRGWHVHSEQTIYTLKSSKPTWKWSTTHEERIGEETFLSNARIENWSSCTKYIVTSVHIWKKPQRKTIKNHVCMLLHREALSVIRCVLLRAYSNWYLLQIREKKVSVDFKWPSCHVHF